MMQRKRVLTAVGMLIAGCLSLASFAAERPLSTDRPDTTESPYSVDKGFFQMELEPISWSRDRADGLTAKSLVSGANLKWGLSDATDIQFVFEYIHDAKLTGEPSASGVGDTQIRYKINLWGNDEGDTALALMPFVQFDTHSKKLGPAGKTEAGLIVPLGFSLPNDWGAAAMIELDAVRDEANKKYVPEWVLSITFAHDIAHDWGGFLELVQVSRDERGAASEAYFNSGLTKAIGERMQLDFGFNAGLTDASEDWRLFLGFSMKMAR